MLDLLSCNPARRAVERYWLRYTVVWGIVGGVIMLSGLAERWGDAGLMALGVAFALGAVVPMWRPHDDERAVPIHQRAATKLTLSVVTFSFLMNYFCTPYFFDVLHMHYGFRATITIQNNPIFLYLMTVAYFATYLVLVCMAYRLSQRLGSGITKVVGALLAPFAVAGLETVLNANPFMASLFCFDDMPFMLWFGTLSYGVCFVFAMPVWMRIDESSDQRRSLLRVFGETLAAMMLIVISFELLRHLVAPLVTTVEPQAIGLRDYDGSCLVRPSQEN
jgi:hypothetical protein